MSHYLIIGLGNPGEEYKDSRHNAGRIILDYFQDTVGFSEWSYDKNIKALSSGGKIEKNKVLLLKPETFMNKSGLSVKSLIEKEKDAERLIVLYDDLDLPIGSFRISFNRSSGGHKGVESIIKNLKTEKFLRIRIGICPVTPSGKLKKPKGEEVVTDFLMGDFKKNELDILREISKAVGEAITMIIKDGREKAMGEFNRR